MATMVTTLAAFFTATKGIKQQRKHFIQLTALGSGASWDRSTRQLVTLHHQHRMHSRSRTQMLVCRPLSPFIQDSSP